MSPRFHRGLLFGCLGILLLILLLIVTRPLYLPDAFVLRLIERKINSSTSVRLSIENGRIRILKGLDLRGVTAADAAGNWRLQIDEFSFRYRFPPFWKKKLVLTKLQLDHPQIYTSIELSDTAVSSTPSVGPAEIFSSRPEFSLPFAIEIIRFSIRDLQLDISLRTASGDFRASSGGLQIESQDLTIRNNREFLVNFVVRQDDSLSICWNAPDPIVSFASSSDFSLKAALAPDSAQAVYQWRLSPILMLNSRNREVVGGISKIESGAGARLLGYRDFILDSLTLCIEDWFSLQAYGEARDISKTGAVSARIPSAELDLGKMQTYIQNLFPTTTSNYGGSASQATGKLQIRDASIEGTMYSADSTLGVVIPWSISDLDYSDSRVGYRIRGGLVRSVLEARISPRDSFRFTDETELACNTILVNIGGNKPMRLNHITGGFSAGISPGFTKPFFRLKWQAQGPDQAFQNGALNLQADSLMLDDFASSPGFSVELTAKSNRLDLANLTAGVCRGGLDAVADIRMHRLRDFSAKFSAFPRDVSIPLESDTLRIAQMRINAVVDGTLRDDFSGLNVQNAVLEAPPYGSVSFRGSFEKRPGWDLQDLRARLDLSEWAMLSRTFLSAHNAAVFASGTIDITGFARGQLSSDSLHSEENLSVQGSELAVHLPDAGFSADSSSLNLEVTRENQKVHFSGETKIGRLFLSNWREEPLRNLEGGASGRISEFHQLRDALFWLELRELGLDAQAFINAEFPPNRISFDLETQLAFFAKEPIQPLPGVSLAGKFDGSLEAHFSPDSLLNLNGALRSENFTFGMTDGFQVENLSLQLPYEQTFRITAEGAHIQFENSTPLALDDPVLFASMQHQFGPRNENGRVRMSSAAFKEYRIQNLRGNLFFRQGRLAFPQFSLDAYDGTIYGGGRVDIPEFTPDSVRYRLQFALESVNSALLPGIRSTTRGEDARITAFARFLGQGVRTDGYLDLEGGVDITQIGPKVADNLLKFLDPEETDPSIQAYRGYLSRGWGVKVFSFTINDDFVYASITPAQPPLSKPDMFLVSRLVGLGKSITFGRVPLKFFLSQSNAKQP